MSFSEINWPQSPENGQVYTSSFGRIWVWDGFAWTSTCCPPSVCDPYENGIVFKIGIQFGNEGDLETFIYISSKYAQYSESPTWISYIGESPFLSLFRTSDGWALKDPDGNFITTLAQDVDIPIGTWEPSEFISSFEASCGVGRPTYCMSIADGFSEVINFLPVYLSNGEILFYTSFSNIFIFWDEENSRWTLVDTGEDPAAIFAVFPGSIGTAPVGTWTPLVSPTESISIEMYQNPNQNCPCETTIDGVTLVVKSIEEGSEFTTFRYFQWNGSEYYTATDPELIIQYSDGTYSALISGNAIATSNSLIGPWDIDPNFPFVVSVEGICGYFPNSSVCLTVGGSPSTQYSLYRSESNGDVTYLNDNSDDIQIRFNAESEIWEIVIPSTETIIGTTPGTAMGPYNNGVLISDIPPYEIYIEEGPCFLG